MVTLQDIRDAAEILEGIAVRTPLVEWTPATDRHKLYLKLENQQPIGAFKIRGAYNKISSLSSVERSRGVITYSSGNHGQGVAFAARAVGVKAVIVMPANAPRNKIDATAALGAEIITVGPTSEERRIRAEKLAHENGYAIVPPYDDEKIIAGQGTVGLEILEDLPNVNIVLVPVGGGGLLSGIATAIKLSNPNIRVIGVEPELAGDARASLLSGRVVSFPPDQVLQTLADGLRTQSIGKLNFEHIRAYVDEIVTVTEDEIRAAVRALSANPKTLAEPSGAVAPAAFFSRRIDPADAPVTVAVISGGNIDPALLQSLTTESELRSRSAFHAPRSNSMPLRPSSAESKT